MWGDSDRVVTPAYGRAVAESFPNARLVVIAQCGHMPQIEQPARLLDLVASMRMRACVVATLNMAFMVAS